MGQGTIDCAQYENDLPFDIMSLNLFKVGYFLSLTHVSVVHTLYRIRNVVYLLFAD